MQKLVKSSQMRLTHAPLRQRSVMKIIQNIILVSSFRLEYAISPDVPDYLPLLVAQIAAAWVQASVQHATCLAVFTCTCHKISGMLWNVVGRWAHVEGEGALVPGPGVLAGVEGHQVGRPRLCSSHVGAATIEVLKLCTGHQAHYQLALRQR